MALLALLQKKYEHIEVIGEGGFSKVFIAIKKNENKVVALKIVPLHNKIVSKLYKRECKLLKGLSHPNITSYISDNKIKCHGQSYGILVQEKLDMDLLSFLQFKPQLTFRESKIIFHKVCKAVAHCHANSVAHLDLKVENILIRFCEKETVKAVEEVKICDFGYARRWKKNNRTFYTDGRIGTAEYRAPELNFLVLTEKMGWIAMDKADIWSLGVILFTLITGHFPFVFENSFMTSRIDLAVINQFTPDKRCFKLISKILDEDLNNRPSIEEILHDSFFM